MFRERTLTLYTLTYIASHVNLHLSDSDAQRWERKKQIEKEDKVLRKRAKADRCNQTTTGRIKGRFEMSNSGLLMARCDLFSEEFKDIYLTNVNHFPLLWLFLIEVWVE